MNTKNDGGQAFPCALPDSILDGSIIRQGGISNGMSLRDWFAGMALQGFLARPQGADIKINNVSLSYDTASYVLADAMLQERTK